MRRLSLAVGLTLGLVMVAFTSPGVLETSTGVAFAAIAGLSILGLVLWVHYTSPERATSNALSKAQKTCLRAVRRLNDDAGNTYDRVVLLVRTLSPESRARVEREWLEVLQAIEIALSSYQSMTEHFLGDGLIADPHGWMVRKTANFQKVERLALEAHKQLDCLRVLCDEAEAANEAD